MGNIWSNSTKQVKHQSSRRSQDEHYPKMRDAVQQESEQERQRRNERERERRQEQERLEMKQRQLEENLRIRRQQLLTNMEHLVQTESPVSYNPDFEITYFTHLNVSICIQLLSDISLLPNYTQSLSPGPRAKKSTTHVVGSFTCKHKKNAAAWKSGKIYTEIMVQLHNDKFYFTVNVYNQKCRRCQRICSPKLDEMVYKERITSKLLLLLGLRDRIDYSGETKETPPHRQDLCCACLSGKCQHEKG
jgi:hypothetical protein